MLYPVQWTSRTNKYYLKHFLPLFEVGVADGLRRLCVRWNCNASFTTPLTLLGIVYQTSLCVYLSSRMCYEKALSYYFQNDFFFEMLKKLRASLES